MGSNIVTILVAVSVLASGNVFAAGDGGYAGSFLGLGAGACPLGMGRPFICTTHDTLRFWALR